MLTGTMEIPGIPGVLGFHRGARFPGGPGIPRLLGVLRFPGVLKYCWLRILALNFYTKTIMYHQNILVESTCLTVIIA